MGSKAKRTIIIYIDNTMDVEAGRTRLSCCYSLQGMKFAHLTILSTTVLIWLEKQYS